MESFLVSIHAIFPILLIILLGYVVRHKKMVSQSVFQGMNLLCFKIFLPFLLFYNVYTTKANQELRWEFILFTCSGIIMLFFVLTVCVPRFVKNSPRQGTIIQGIFRSNFIILGLPIAQSVYRGENIATISLLAAFVVPLFNFLSVLTLSSHGEQTISPRETLIQIIKNPLIIFSLLGFLCFKCNVIIPDTLLTTIKSIGSIGTPLAIFTLGGNLVFYEVKKNIKVIIQCIFLKNIIVPIFMIGLAIILGFRNIELLGITTVFATPTAVVSYVMAEQTKCDGKLAGQIVIASTIFSGLTVFSFVFVLSLLNLI